MMLLTISPVGQGKQMKEMKSAPEQRQELDFATRLPTGS